MTQPLSTPLPGLRYAGAANQPALFSSLLKVRDLDTHKGSFGSLHVVGGAPGMVGAALLAARSALYAGAGRVLVYPLEKLSHDAAHPELMLRDLDSLPAALAAAPNEHSGLVCGPGLGNNSTACSVLAHSLASTLPLVLDADALNLIAEQPDLAEALKNREAVSVITPHPLEAARLLRCSVEHIQHDRAEAARQLARQFNCLVILKGAGSVIAGVKSQHAAETESTQADWVINRTGNPALATAGSGDVLAGLLGTLLMQSPQQAFKAACAAVWLHGQAADDWAAQQGGTVGLTASELPSLIRQCLNRLLPHF